MKKLSMGLLLAYIASAGCVARAQSALTTPAAAPLTLREQANLVVVDVVVQDKYFQPLRNLKLDDFTLLENKLPQKITSLEEHTALSPVEAARFPPLPKLPPGIFTNISPAPPNSAVNVLLLDALNTPLSDQIYLREQIMHYLDGPHAGANIAIFGL